jgi:hypothetical protein
MTEMFVDRLVVRFLLPTFGIDYITLALRLIHIHPAKRLFITIRLVMRL